MILWSKKTENWHKFSIYNKDCSLACSLVYQHLTIHYYVFLKIIPGQLPLLHHPYVFFVYTLSSITCCFRSSSKHFIHIGPSKAKIISLYLIIVSFMASWKSSIEINSCKVYSFTLFLLKNLTMCLCIFL